MFQIKIYHLWNNVWDQYETNCNSDDNDNDERQGLRHICLEPQQCYNYNYHHPMMATTTIPPATTSNHQMQPQWQQGWQQWWEGDNNNNNERWGSRHIFLKPQVCFFSFCFFIFLIFILLVFIYICLRQTHGTQDMNASPTPAQHHHPQQWHCLPPPSLCHLHNDNDDAKVIAKHQWATKPMKRAQTMFYHHLGPTYIYIK